MFKKRNKNKDLEKKINDLNDFIYKMYQSELNSVELNDFIMDFIHDNFDNEKIRELYQAIDNWYDECKKNLMSGSKRHG